MRTKSYNLQIQFNFKTHGLMKKRRGKGERLVYSGFFKRRKILTSFHVIQYLSNPSICLPCYVSSLYNISHIHPFLAASLPFSIPYHLPKKNKMFTLVIKSSSQLRNICTRKRSYSTPLSGSSHPVLEQLR